MQVVVIASTHVCV